MTYTSIEQSKKLLELGLSPESADMFYEKTTEEPEFKVCVGKNIAIKFNLFSYRNGHVIPCWSLGALLELIPTYALWKENRDNTTKYRIDYRWYHFDWYDTIIEAIVDIIEQLH